MDNLADVYAKHKWYSQGVGATPLLIGCCATSGFSLDKLGLGVEYTHFLYRYDGTKAEMLYDHEDLQRIWEKTKAKLLEEPGYLHNIEAKYSRDFEHYHAFMQSAREGKVNESSNEELVDLLKTAVHMQRDSVGLAHVIEPISIIGTDEMYEEIHSRSPSKEHTNQIISKLFEPTQKSFVAKEEEDLLKIAALHSSEKEVRLQEHIDTYYWIGNTYVGEQSVTVDSLQERLEQLKNFKSKKAQTFLKKEEIVEDMNLNDETKALVEALNFCTTWQDDRKLNILKSISFFDTVLKEISRRIGVGRLSLKYLGVHEAENVGTLGELTNMKDVLEHRQGGVYYYLRRNDDEFSNYETFREISTLHHPEEERTLVGDIRGMSACLGTAIGEVRICTDIDTLPEFPEGAILVAKMTRPEYVSAMKKAAAIVTDEGGITSHAAIVSRELGVPCIIGTQDATKILKDGDVVEVRANHGFVRIVQRED